MRTALLATNELALPPMAGDHKQLGQTLRFTIDWFRVDATGDMRGVLRALDEKAQALELALRLYRPAF
jgi:hypothetical protein